MAESKGSRNSQKFVAALLALTYTIHKAVQK